MMRNRLTPLTSTELLRGVYFDEFDGGQGGRNRKAIFAKPFDVELNRFLDKRQDFVTSLRDRYTTR